MGRTPSCSKDQGMNKGAWTAIEDRILTDYIKLHGEGKWRHIPRQAGLKRCGKSCRLRWMNYLRPDIKRGNISHDEEDLIIRLHKLLGNRWSLIAGRLPGRTDNEIKNYWNTHLSKGGQKKQRETKTNHSEVEKEPIISSTVIRTKASRCREVFINPDCYQQPRFGNHVKTVNLEHIVEEESETRNRSITTMPSFKEENCLGFMVDADAGEISVSEIFSPEMGNVMQGEVDVDNYLSTFAVPQDFFLADEVEQKWSGTDYIQEHLDSDFESFLESAEEWLI